MKRLLLYAATEFGKLHWIKIYTEQITALENAIQV